MNMLYTETLDILVDRLVGHWLFNVDLLQPWPHIYYYRQTWGGGICGLGFSDVDVSSRESSLQSTKLWRMTL